MTGSDRELAEIRRQLEINNALLEALTLMSARQEEIVRQLARAFELPVGDDVVVTILRRLEASSKRIFEMLERMVGPPTT